MLGGYMELLFLVLWLFFKTMPEVLDNAKKSLKRVL
jgi:hypothetical protein